MNEILLLLVCINSFFLLGLSLLFFIRIKNSNDIKWSKSRQLTLNQSQERFSEAKVELKYEDKNPLRDISFEEFLYKGKESFKSDIENEKDRINNLLSKLPQAVEIGLQVKEIFLENKLMRVAFSHSTSEKLASGSLRLMKGKSMNQLSIAVDTTTGKIVEHAKEIPDVLFNTVNWASLGMNVVHLLAGWDNAKALKSINIKLDTILNDKKFEKIARLSAIYEALRESFEYSPELRRQQLLQLKVDLKYLRSMWLFKVNSDLEKVKTPEDASWWFNKSKKKKGELKKILETDELLCLVIITLALDEYISVGLGNYTVYKEITLPSVGKQLEAVHKKTVGLRLKLQDNLLPDQELLNSEQNYRKVLKTLIFEKKDKLSA